MEIMLMNHPRDLKNLCLFEIAFILVYSHGGVIEGA